MYSGELGVELINRVIFHDEAKEELYYAIDYYKQINKNLAASFLKEIEFSLENITFYPYAWTLLDSNIRRVLLKRFPYSLLYAIKEDKIFIVAVMNLRKRPNYWKNRLK